VSRAPRQSRGFSLTELLVAMVIGLLLLAGLVALMLSSQKNYAQQDYSARLQENARFAMQFLSYDIRMAGYYGCSNDIVNDDSVGAVDVPDDNPDTVTITYAEPYQDADTVRVVQADNTLTWTLNRVPEDWSVDERIVVADCASAAVTTITGIDTDNNQITVAGGLGRSVDPAVNDSGAIVVRRLLSHTYVIGDSGESGIPVLTRNDQELVEGVENIRLLYQDGPGDVFDASAPDRPSAIQLGALIRSVSNENLDADNNREFGSGAEITVDAGGNDADCEGGHMVLDECVAVAPLRGQRRVFTTTLSVRNRPL